jgi:hypothetical protein
LGKEKPASPKPTVNLTRNKCSYCSKQSQPTPIKQISRRRNNFRDKFRYSTPIPEKEIIITSYNMKLNEKIPSFCSAKLLKEFRDEIIVQAKSHHLAINYDKYTKQKNWTTFIPSFMKKKSYKVNDFISRAKVQVNLYKTLAKEKIRLLIIENTPTKILTIELDYRSEECNRIYHMTDFSYYKEFEEIEEEHRFITVRDYYTLKYDYPGINDREILDVMWRAYRKAEIIRMLKDSQDKPYPYCPMRCSKARDFDYLKDDKLEEQELENITLAANSKKWIPHVIEIFEHLKKRYSQ